MKAIFAGTIADGFCMVDLVSDADSQAKVINHSANGSYAEAIEVIDPASVDKSFARAEGGSIVTVIGDRLSEGFFVYGPFDDDDIASNFGEANRGEDGEWELFEI